MGSDSGWVSDGDPMLYILRLTGGDCVVVLASDEHNARKAAAELNADDAETVASVRPLDHFRIQLSPTENGTLDVARWDDGALDDILGNEYPLLYRAYCRANAAHFARTAESEEPILMHLKAEFERNTEIIRQGLRLELQRFGPREGSPKAKTARAHT